MGFYEKRTVLVTGATGLVGANLIQRLLPLGVHVRATLHRRDPVISDPKIDYIKCDLTNPDDCRKIVPEVDYVFHCAANTSGAHVITNNPLTHVTTNIVMNAYLLEAAYQAKVLKFLWISSSTGYPSTGTRPMKEEEMMVGDPFDKYFGVGWMKRYSEVLCRMYAEKLKVPMATIVLRATNIYGEYDDFDFETSHAFAALIRKVAQRHRPIEVWGTGEDVRDLIYVGDFIEAMLIAMEKCYGYKVFNIGFGRGYKIKEVLNMILEEDGYHDARLTFDATKPTTIPIRLVDIRKAEKELGFKPKTFLREGIRKTLHWYKAHQMEKAEKAA
ncbi:MAG TPA: hypothetical protein DD723_03370 [Candidatus Omnitrophica bacterium]|nr:MAG: hypothetical protein A2Z81_00905 [Omnitrophica WOR_2 bacterium GWA2_45_18]HBR14570.1 hypothetical protein [Candidatus Omnitrophota bacterium]